MKVKLSRLAKNRLRELGLSEDFLGKILRNPDDTSVDKIGHNVFWKKMPEGYFKVVCAIEEKKINVVTIYLKRKRGKS